MSKSNSIMKSLILVVAYLTIIQNVQSEAGNFATQLFYNVAKEKATQNFVISPIALQSCLTKLYNAANGITAYELKTALQNANQLNDNAAQIKIPTRLFLDRNYQVTNNFKNITESVDFREQNAIVQSINKWVQKATDFKIRKMIDAKTLPHNTVALIANAIHFKSSWRQQFNADYTYKSDFAISSRHKIMVDTMHQNGKFLYGEIAELNAKILQMNYTEPKVSMWILLPDRIDGLAELEKKLKTVDVFALSKRLREQQVFVHLPKFKIEFDLSLKSTLRALGIHTMFTPAANFRKLLTNPANLSFNDLRHSALLEVNEVGTEAVSGLVGATLSEDRGYDFNAKHPFAFIIKDDASIYIAGHVVSF